MSHPWLKEENVQMPNAPADFSSESPMEVIGALNISMPPLRALVVPLLWTAFSITSVSLGYSVNYSLVLYMVQAIRLYILVQLKMREIRNNIPNMQAKRFLMIRDIANSMTHEDRWFVLIWFIVTLFFFSVFQLRQANVFLCMFKEPVTQCLLNYVKANVLFTVMDILLKAMLMHTIIFLLMLKSYVNMKFRQELEE